MKDYKIKFKLEKWGRTLVFQVLDMDERFIRGKFDGILEYVSSNNFSIKSFGSTELDKSIIYLRGCGESALDKVEIRTFPTKSLMDLYYDKALFALEDWSNNWEGFKEDEVRKIRKPKDGIFSFNDKIEFRLEKFECNLVFQVLGMDERFRCVDNIDNIYRTSNRYWVCSKGCPKIGGNIFLHGQEKNNDTTIETVQYINNHKRNLDYDKILEALKDWSMNWEGFKENKSISNKDGIFTF